MTLPHDNNPPVVSFKQHDFLDVPFPVIPNLLHPEIRIRLRNHKLAAALMPVPETPVYKYTGAVFRQHDIRRARQRLDIGPIPVTEPVQFLTQLHLRPCILRPDMRHAIVPLLPCKNICHYSLPSKGNAGRSSPKSNLSKSLLYNRS